MECDFCEEDKPPYWILEMVENKKHGRWITVHFCSAECLLLFLRYRVKFDKKKLKVSFEVKVKNK